MKAKLIFIIFFSIVTLHVTSGQQMPIYSQYIHNWYLINPAAASLDFQTDLSFFSRKQWTSLEHFYPKTFHLTAATKTSESILAGAIYFDSWGKSSIFYSGFTYGQSFKLDDNGNMITFGLTFNVKEFSINQNDYVYFHDNDQAISGLFEKYMTPDADFGVLFNNQSLTIGTSIKNIMSPKLIIGTNTSENNHFVRSYYFHARYKFSPLNNFESHPSILLRYYASGIFGVDLNLHFALYENLNFGAALRWPASVCYFISFNYNNFRIGYAYDFALRPIRSYAGKTHEVFVSYLLPIKHEKAFL